MGDSLPGQGLAALLRHVSTVPGTAAPVRDITPILRHAQGLRAVIETMAGSMRDVPIDLVAGVDAGGILFAAPLAYTLRVGLVLVRKPGKLPGATLSVGQDPEDQRPGLELHRDAIRPGQQVFIVDDILATGSTARAACALVEQAGGRIAGLGFLLDLGLPGARVGLHGYRIAALAQAPGYQGAEGPRNEQR